MHVSQEGFADWRQTLDDKMPKIMKFKHNALGGRLMQEPLRSNGMDLQAAKILSNLDHCLRKIMIALFAECFKLVACALEALQVMILIADNGAKVLICFIFNSKKLAEHDRSQRFWDYVAKIMHSGIAEADELFKEELVGKYAKKAYRMGADDVVGCLFMGRGVRVIVSLLICLILAHSIKRLILAHRSHREASLCCGRR